MRHTAHPRPYRPRRRESDSHGRRCRRPRQLRGQNCRPVASVHPDKPGRGKQNSPPIPDEKPMPAAPDELTDQTVSPWMDSRSSAPSMPHNAPVKPLAPMSWRSTSKHPWLRHRVSYTTDSMGKCCLRCHTWPVESAKAHRRLHRVAISQSGHDDFACALSVFPRHAEHVVFGHCVWAACQLACRQVLHLSRRRRVCALSKCSPGDTAPALGVRPRQALRGVGVPAQSHTIRCPRHSK